jgi:hypothetical protein
VKFNLLKLKSELVIGQGLGGAKPIPTVPRERKLERGVAK